jgi:hypothetical protein
LFDNRPRCVEVHRPMSDEDPKNQLAVLSDLNIEKMLTDPVDSFTDEQAASAWAVIDLMEKVIEERKKNLRESLLHRAHQTGTKNETGSYTAKMGAVTVISEKRQASLPDEKVVEACLKDAGLEYEDAFTGQMVWKLDPSKVEFLVKGGKLPADKIEDSKKATWALKVKPDKEVKAQLDTIKKKLSSGE